MKNIKNHIKNNSFSKVYLVYGKEDFFKNNILNLLLENIFLSSSCNSGLEMMNTSTFDYSDTFSNFDAQDIISICSTPPFMSDKRIVVIKDTQIFKEDKLSLREALTSYLKDLPEFCIIIFLENSINKSTKLFKQIDKIGSTHDVDNTTESDIVKYVISTAKKSNTQINAETAMYFISHVGLNLYVITSELNKLIYYLKDNNNNNNNISIIDINDICTKSIETQIFDLIDNIANKNLNSVIEIYQNLLYNKTSPYNILVMISWQFRVILKVKSSNSSNQNQIAKDLNMSWYTVKKALLQVRYFNNKQLIQALNDCLETDINIKSGLVQPELAVEMLIIKYASNK